MTVPAKPSKDSPTLRVLRGGVDRSDDLDTARRVAAGDRVAAAELYDRHVGRVSATIFRVLGRRDSHHSDLVQSAFVQVVLSLGRFQGDSSLSTWVMRVATHVALNALRSERRSRAVFAPEEAEGSVRCGDPMLASRLRAALAEISPEKAETVVLHDMLGHDLAEIAKMMDVTVAAAQSRLVRGRGELRELLGDLAPGGKGS